MTNDDQRKQLDEMMQELLDASTLFYLALLGAQSSVDPQTMGCLVRLSDYMMKSIKRVEMMMDEMGLLSDKEPC